MLIKDWMTSPVYVVSPDDSFSAAIRLAKERSVKHLPVVQDGKLVGILSDRDLKEAAPSSATSLDMYEINYLMEKTKVKDLMRLKVVTGRPDMPIEEAALLLYNHHIGCLPVVEGDRLVGIISDRDMYNVLVEITGVRRGGSRISVGLKDAPGSIKDAADIVRRFGFRVNSILSTPEKAAPGQRYVVLRIAGAGDLKGLTEEFEHTYAQFHII